jgi:ABC-2 type transport system permease protein
MSIEQSAGVAREAHRAKARSTWSLILTRELFELWVGGKAIVLVIIYSVLLGMTAFVTSNNSELELIPPKELVFMTLNTAIAIGLFIGLITGADSISGERERGTLEALLLTPTSRRQIVLGKYLAAVSPWPLALALTYPYLAMFAQGGNSWIRALLWGAFVGSILTLAFAALGMLVSIWSNSNKTSMVVALVIYISFYIPTQWAGAAQTGVTGRAFKRIDPMEAGNHFLEKILVNNRTLAEFWPWLAAPVIFLLITAGLLFAFAAPRIRVDAWRGERAG